jgi:ATP-dependent helicase Lhr and Lhr-like helicase
MPGLTVQQLSAALDSIEWRNPGVDSNALRGLKFSAALPEPLARETLSARLGDSENAQSVVGEARTIIMQQR